MVLQSNPVLASQNAVDIRVTKHTILWQAHTAIGPDEE